MTVEAFVVISSATYALSAIKTATRAVRNCFCGSQGNPKSRED
jgi:hypothetical protein